MLINSSRFEESLSAKTDSPVKLLNIGCGNHFHPAWTNVDLISQSLDVIPYDVTTGLPFPDNSFDAVYHSHVIEHLQRNQGIDLIRECLRVLKPGGVARIVVPDLEKIAKLYLEKHDRAWQGDEQAKTDYDWMKLELLDQMVRNRSGGQMGPYMANPEIRNSEFVRSRVGDEYNLCKPYEQSPVKQSEGDTIESPQRRRSVQTVVAASKTLRMKIAQKIVRVLLGQSAEQAFTEGLFRNSGEVHRWMYDRYSLRNLCEYIGFDNFQVLHAHSSQIPAFQTYQLDVVDGEVRKPDSLFAECRKPNNAAVRPVRN